MPARAGSALVTTLATFAVVARRARPVRPRDAGFQMVEQASWVPSIGLQYLVGVDGISLWLVLLTTFLFPVSVLASWTIDDGRAPVHGRDAGARDRRARVRSSRWT